MDRGACQATIHGITKVRYNLATETPFDFDYNTFVIWLKIRRCDASSFFLFLKIALAIYYLLWFHMGFPGGTSGELYNYLPCEKCSVKFWEELY